MQRCPECGNHAMRVRAIDGAAVHECELCGARFGERRAVGALTANDEAHARGLPAEVWPLVRALERLGDVSVRRADAGTAATGELPQVEFWLHRAGALVQLENLAKSLRLSAGALRCRWCIEVAFEQALTFVLRPRRGSGSRNDAQIDVETLARALERDMALTWWRHANRSDDE